MQIFLIVVTRRVKSGMFNSVDSITYEGNILNQLYILDSENVARSVSWQEYDAWEETNPKESRTAFGKRLAVNHFGEITVLTVFVSTPIGYFGRKPQLWITLTIGPNIWEESRYSSHRAAMSGHASACKSAVPKVLVENF
jgi:hypothetical protein